METRDAPPKLPFAMRAYGLAGMAACELRGFEGTCLTARHCRLQLETFQEFVLLAVRAERDAAADIAVPRGVVVESAVSEACQSFLDETRTMRRTKGCPQTLHHAAHHVLNLLDETVDSRDAPPQKGTVCIPVHTKSPNQHGRNSRHTGQRNTSATSREPEPKRKSQHTSASAVGRKRT